MKQKLVAFGFLGFALILVQSCNQNDEECCSCPPTVFNSINICSEDDAPNSSYDLMWQALAPLTQNDAPQSWEEFRLWLETNGCDCE
jgi:hypothetical protein